MSKKQKRRVKPKSKTPMKRRTVDDGPVYFKHPLSNIDPKVMRRGREELAEKAREMLPKTLDWIIDQLRTYNGLQTLAMLTTYGLFTGIGGSEHREKHRLSAESGCV